MYQNITIVGNVGRDPEMRYTPNGKAVASFSVATSRKFGNGQEKTVWFRISVWEKMAETVSEYVKKGMKVLVVGELEPLRIYTDKQGEPAAQFEVTAQNVRFLSRVDDEGEGAPARSSQQSRRQEEPDFNDEDIPF